MASNIFLQLDGIKGEAEDQNHKEWIELSSYSTGASNSTVFAHLGKAKHGSAYFQGFACEMGMDASLVKLMESCLNGTVIKKGVIDIAGNDKKSLLKYSLDNILVTNLDLSGEGRAAKVSFTLETVVVKLETFAADGKASGAVAFNRSLNTVVK